MPVSNAAINEKNARRTQDVARSVAPVWIRNGGTMPRHPRMPDKLMTRITRALVSLALLPFSSVAQLANPSAQPSSSPSFDCAKARGRIEKAICADSALATLDRRVADLFAVATSQATDPGDLKRS